MLQERFRGRVAVRLAFDPPLSRRVYAGADFFFVPSRFEPCGLTQMYAMRYGSIPIVTDVGGLHDTVEPIDVADDRGTGFVAAVCRCRTLRGATLAAFALYADPPAMARAYAARHGQGLLVGRSGSRVRGALRASDDTLHEA